MGANRKVFHCPVHAELFLDADNIHSTRATTNFENDCREGNITRGGKVWAHTLVSDLHGVSRYVLYLYEAFSGKCHWRADKLIEGLN